MVHIYPFFSIGTVELDHYNTMASIWQIQGFFLNHQRLGYGFGFGLGYSWKLFEMGTSLVMFVSSSTSEGVFQESGDWVNYHFRHALFNYLVNFHTGLNYNLRENFFIYVGIKPMFGFSNLKWFLRYWLGPYYYEYYEIDASLNSSSFGIGFEIKEEVYISKYLGIFLSLGYDMINFKEYRGYAWETYFFEGEIERRYLPRVYLVYNYKESLLYPSDQPPLGNALGNEIWGEENLSGFRFSFGLKLRLGGKN